MDCFDVRKELGPYIQSKYLIPQNIDRNMIYPNDNDSKKIESWLTNDKNKI